MILASRREIFVTAFVSAVLLGLASYAWACSPFATLEPHGSGRTSRGTASGPAGSGVTLTGQNFYPDRSATPGFNEGEVRIRWNSVTGEQLGTATGPDFTVRVTVPQTSPGTYYFVAVQYSPDGNVRGSARAAFEVTSTSTEPRDQASGSADEGEASGQTSGTTSGSEESQTSGSGQTSGSTSGSIASGSGQTSGSTSGDEGEPTSGNGQTSGSTSGHRGEHHSRAGQTSTSTSGNEGTRVVHSGSTSGSDRLDGRPFNGSNNPLILTAPSGQRVFGGSVSAGSFAGLERNIPDRSSSSDVSASPSDSTVFADAFGDLQPGPNTSLIPALVPGSSEDAPTSYLSMAIMLFGMALVTIVGGFMAAMVRRRPVTETPSR